MENCSFCESAWAQYKEEGTDKKYCSYQCQCIEQTIDDERHTELYSRALRLDAPQRDVKRKNYGPIIDSSFVYAKPLRKFILKSTEYINTLSLFDQYLVWRYTIGSASVNMFLILGKISNEDNAKQWCYFFFLYWKNTRDVMEKGQPSEKFRKFQRFFTDPSLFRKLTIDQAQPIIQDLLQLYASSLQSIIQQSPPVKTGFHLYKVAGDYPGLPTSPSDVPKVVTQKPFNSSTINPNFNFAFFISKEATGNLFDLRIRPGSHILYIPAEFHAYPFEKEVLLPIGAKFTITSSYNGVLTTIDKESLKLNKLQQPPSSIMLGPVYEISPYHPCSQQVCSTEKRVFTIFLCDYDDKA
jgi:hypothetical protein